MFLGDFIQSKFSDLYTWFLFNTQVIGSFHSWLLPNSTLYFNREVYCMITWRMAVWCFLKQGRLWVWGILLWQTQLEGFSDRLSPVGRKWNHQVGHHKQHEGIFKSKTGWSGYASIKNEALELRLEKGEEASHVGGQGEPRKGIWWTWKIFSFFFWES